MRLELSRSIGDVVGAEWSSLAASEAEPESVRVWALDAAGLKNPTRREAVVVSFGVAVVMLAVTVYWVMAAVVTLETAWGPVFYMGGK